MQTIILSGGVGSRLWPISRKLHPKPFIKLEDGLSILQHTFLRALNIGSTAIVNVTGKEFIFKVKSEANTVLKIANTDLPTSYIVEPFGRGTAAAIALAALWIAETQSPDELMLVMPSDHLITNNKLFLTAVTEAKILASQNKLVTLGIIPTAPETGYGYIEFENNHVIRFVEKPAFDLALKYSQSSNYLWNSGMLIFKAGVMLEEMALHCPEILDTAKHCYSLSKAIDNQFILDPNSLLQIKEDTIDYAVMEKSANIAVVACDREMGWNDIGSWDAFSKTMSADANNNVINAQAITNKVSNCYFESNHPERIIGAIGLDNLVIVDTDDALLIAHKNNLQEVRGIYNQLMKNNHPSHELHTTVHRPWGTYTILENNTNFKIKRIEVYPGASLSLQSHQYRSEHWVVIEGTAHVVNGEQELILNINESTFIPAKNKHRLSNNTDKTLKIIEVQTGTYLEEDDIVRYDDIYDRVEQ